MHSDTVRELFAREAHNPSHASICASLPDITPVDFCVPVNRHFPPPALLQRIRDQLPDILKYYPDYASTHQQALSRLVDIPADNLVVANGSTEIITQLCRQLPSPLATSIPTFGQWTDLPLRFERELHLIQRLPEHDFVLGVEQLKAAVRSHGIRTLVLSNPNNPTGMAFSIEDIARLRDELPELDTLVIDESFIDFSDQQGAASLALHSPGLIVVKSLGKSLGWHGIRLGYAVACREQAVALREQLPCWNVNALAAFVLQAVVEMRPALLESFEQVKADRHAFHAALARNPRLRVFASEANFLLVELPESVCGLALRDTLLQEHALLVRECSNKRGSSARYLRLAVNLPHENARLVQALSALLPSREAAFAAY